MNRLRACTRALLAYTVGLFGLVFGALVWAQSFDGLSPADPQPAAGDLAPGLAVTYYYAKFRDVADITDLVPGVEGEPIPLLDHVTQHAKVLTSNRPMGVGAEIRGFINFPQAGVWTLRVKSNDGVKVMVGGVMIHEDPEVHSDSMSAPLALSIATPGWHAFDIDYFQRKGTSALQVFWTPPGAAEESVVPAEAYAHLKP